MREARFINSIRNSLSANKIVPFISKEIPN